MALDITIVNNRATKGGPQPAEMTIMLNDANKTLAEQRKWIDERYAVLADAEKKLNGDFEKLLV